MEIDGVIFDMDGVLVDSMPMWSVLPNEIVASFGVDTTENLAEKLFSYTLEEAAAYLAREYHVEMTEQQMMDKCTEIALEHYKNDIELKPGAAEIIRTFDQNHIPMTVATTSLKCEVEAVLGKYDLLKYMKYVCTPEEFHCGKDVPVMFDAARDHMGTEAERTVLFEDALHSVKTAVKAGYRTIGLYDAASDSRFEEMKKTASHTAGNLAEVLTHVTF